MSTLYERYTPTGDNAVTCEYNFYIGQAITIGNTGTNENHNILSVSFFAYRHGTPGTMTVELYTSDINGKPTGSILSSGTIDANSFTTNTAGAWYSITMSSYTLQASTKYVITCRIGTTGSNYVNIYGADAAGYSGGTLVYSTNHGSSWTAYAAIDLLFEEYGEIPHNDFTLSLSDSVNISENLEREVYYSRSLSDSVNISEILNRQLDFIRTLGDSITVSESLLKSHGFGLSLSDTITVSELLDRQLDFNRSLLETINVSESLSRQLDYNRSLSDTVNVSELLSRQLDFNRSLSDTVNILESLISLLTLESHIIFTYTGGNIHLHRPYFSGPSGDLRFNASNFSFRSGNYASHVDEINDESIVLIGYENISAMAKLVALGIVADTGLEVTISNLSSVWNGIYIINNISYKPIGLDVFEYKISLKFVR